jgi:phosphoribosylanthranilate isomerase
MSDTARLPNVKICGITRFEDAAEAVRLGAWALGFIFYPQSSRYIEPARAKRILQQLAEAGCYPQKTVGVFVNETADHMNQVAAEVGLTTLQLHGDEPADCLKNLAYESIKAVRLRDDDQLSTLAAYQDVAYILVDAAVPGAYGGTGCLADWNLAQRVKSWKPLILSGGLGVDNLVSAWRTVQPAALDLSSGVEEAPGVKSRIKLRRLFQKLEELV